MSFLAILKTAVSSIGGNKLRAGLTLLGIVIGVSAVISLMAIGRGAQEQVTSRIQGLGSNLLFVRPDTSTGTAASLTLEDAFALQDPVFAPSVAAVAPEIASGGQLVAGSKSTTTQVRGVTPDYAMVRGFEAASGSFITWFHVQDSANVAVLGSAPSKTLFGERDPVGQTLRLNGRRFTVVGVLASKGGTALGNQDDQVLVPITTAYYRLSRQRSTQGGVLVQTVYAQITDEKALDAATAEIATVLRLRHRITGADDFAITSQQDILTTLEDTTNTFILFLGAIAGISLLVGGIGVMNIMLVSVTERTREIGIRKAMGAKRRDILFQFMTEAILLTLSGGIVGVLVGVGVAQLLDGRTLGTQSFQTAVSSDVTVLALVVSAAIGLFFGIYPAVRAARLHPIEALRYE